MTEWLSAEVAKLGCEAELRLGDVIEYKQQLFAGYFDAIIDSIDKECHEKAECLKLVWRLLGRLMEKVIESLITKLRGSEHVHFQ